MKSLKKLKDYGVKVILQSNREIIGGISRNAVIGKAHRLNLSAKLRLGLLHLIKNLKIL